VLTAQRFGADARIQYTEGGSFGPEPEEPSSSDLEALISAQQSRDSDAAEEDARLAGIVDELQQLRSSPQAEELDEPIELVAVPKAKGARAVKGQSELDELQRFGAQIRELASESDGPEYEPSEVVEMVEEEVEKPEKPTKPAPSPKASKQKAAAEKPLTAQKKGQSEFVEFVEPVHSKLASKKLKNRETLEKRVADYRMSRLHRDEESGIGLLYSSGNMLFIAFVTMCCVLSVVGVVGGAYYYKHVRSINEDPFDDFTRYSPAGPGRDKLKKNFACEKGDEALAYKAQLHHYQQTKQKIIGDGLNGGHGAMEDDTSDKSDDEADLEHNFSVYECPGLAPTGDIEVQNPNFVDSAASSPTKGP
jgi:hypothetical protein